MSTEVVTSSLSYRDLQVLLDDFFPGRTERQGMAQLQELLGREPRQMEALLVRHLHKTARDRGGKEP